MATVPAQSPTASAYLKSFFHRFGLKSPLLKTDKVRYTEKVVSAYSVPELQALLGAANQDEYDLFQFFLCTGCRDGEVRRRRSSPDGQVSFDR
jgi:integrase